jgi:hypothetical protein
VFWCICTRKPETRNFFFKKDIFYRLEWLKMCFNAFAHISRPPETFLQKIFFWPSGVLKNVFWCICAYFQTTRNLKKKKYFLPSEVVKNVFSLFMHLRILREHQKPFFKKYIFYRLEWLKKCFDAFAHGYRPPVTFFRKDIF